MFKPVAPEELATINVMKKQHISLPAGTEIIHPGEDSPALYTLYSDWAFRFKTLPDGRRQILNFLLPGDLLGLQSAMFDAALHGIEALTDVQLCVLPRCSATYRDWLSTSPGLARGKKASSTKTSPASEGAALPNASPR
jgi:CRP-like cAMP-binding protein